MENTTPHEGIIVAADVPTLAEVERLAKQEEDVPGITGIKIGCMLGLRYGLMEVVRTIRNVSTMSVIYDHQKAGTDIPAMGKPFADVCRDCGVDEVIVFPQAGPLTLAGFVTALIRNELMPIVGLTMSHPEYLLSEGGWIDDGAPSRTRQVASDLGVTHFVLPGNKLDHVKEHATALSEAGVSANIMMPGIGKQGGTIYDAFKATGPHKRRAIIGSAIYKDPDPAQAMRRFAREMLV